MIAFNNCQNYQSPNESLSLSTPIPIEEPMLRIADGENTFESDRYLGPTIFYCHSFGLEMQAADYYQFELKVRSLDANTKDLRDAYFSEVLNQVTIKENNKENQIQFVSKLHSEDKILALDHHEKDLVVEYQFVADSQGVEVLQANISFKGSVKYPLECSL
jgi:hypothetical protein